MPHARSARTMLARLLPVLLVAAGLLPVLGGPAPARADGLIVVDPFPMPPDRPRPPHGHRFAPLEVRQHHVRVRIDDQAATTEVDQVFHNPTGHRLEGTYLFPLPEGAQIERFTMFIDGSPVEAELLDAEKARTIYRDIVRSMKDPALLEYAGTGLFKVRVFPIEPHSDKRLTLKYTQVLRQQGDLVSYRYPMRTERFSAAPIRSLAVRVDIEDERPIRAVYSPSHPMDVRRRDDGRVTLSWEASGVLPDTDLEVLYAPQSTDIGPVAVNVLAHRPPTGPGSDGGFLMLMLTPSELGDDEPAMPKDIVFVVDTSGSMAGEKLDQARGALRFCLRSLNERDRFEVIRFSTEAEALFGGLETISEDSRRKALAFVDDFKAMGGTAIDDALRAGIGATESAKDRPTMVVFLTDGLPTIGETNVDRILAGVGRATADRTVRVFCFGVGNDVNTRLLDRVAERTRATTEYVLPNENLEVKLSGFYRTIDAPILANPALRIEGDVRVHAMHPRTMPDLFAGEQVLLLARYEGHGPATISLRGTIAREAGGGDRDLTITHPVELPKSSDDHAFLPRLWATRRIGWLLDQMRLDGETEELREEVVRLARSYGVVTPYTAYLIIEDEARGGLPMAGRTLAPAAEADPALQRELADRMRQFREDESGAGAVDAAASSKALGAADRAAPGLGGGGLTAGGSIDRPRTAGQPGETVTTFAGGRAFFRTPDGVWVDGTIQSVLEGREEGSIEPEEIEFGSDSYFDLLAEHPETGPWLALGSTVRFRLGDRIVEIVDPTD